MANPEGPQGLGEMDARLAALKAHQEALQSAPTEEDLIQDASLKEFLLPLLAAQGMDFVSTEQFMNSPASSVSGPAYEKNPLPGMQSPLGRVGWGGIEALLMGLLHKKAPGVARGVRAASIGTHTGLARGNQQQAENRLQMWAREQR